MTNEEPSCSWNDSDGSGMNPADMEQRLYDASPGRPGRGRVGPSRRSSRGEKTKI